MLQGPAVAEEVFARDVDLRPVPHVFQVADDLAHVLEAHARGVQHDLHVLHRLEGLFPGIAEQHRAAVTADRPGSGDEGIVAAFHDIDIVAGRFEEAFAPDFLLRRPPFAGL